MQQLEGDILPVVEGCKHRWPVVVVAWHVGGSHWDLEGAGSYPRDNCGCSRDHREGEVLLQRSEVRRQKNHYFEEREPLG